MSLSITFFILCAALFHALWNSLIKSGKDPLLDCMVLSLAATSICAVLLPFFPLPLKESWWFLGVSVVVHVVYFFFLAKGYEAGELSRVYPIMRGLPPLLVTVVSTLFLHEPMPVVGIIGIIMVSGGILSLEFGHKTPSYRAFCMAMIAATMIATYTVIDGLGARVSGSSTSFLLWLSLMESMVFVGLVFYLKKKQLCCAYIRQHIKKGYIGGALSLAAYAIVLYAMTIAPIAYVSALRETSVLFAGLIARIWLKESFTYVKIVSLLCITIGIIMIKF